MICDRLKELHRQHADHQIPVATPDLVRIVCRCCEDDETCPSRPVSFEEAFTQRSPVGRLNTEVAILSAQPRTDPSAI